MSNIFGRKVHLVVSDPWDFVTANGSGPFEATVRELGGEPPGPCRTILFELAVPVPYEGSEYRILSASARYRGSSFEQLATGKSVACNVYGLKGNLSDAEGPSHPSKWRGGLSLIGTIVLPDDAGG